MDIKFGKNDVRASGKTLIRYAENQKIEKTNNLIGETCL